MPDVDRTEFLLILGADPYSSDGSLWTAPDLPGRLKVLRARVDHAVVVDPHRGRTARVRTDDLLIDPAVGHRRSPSPPGAGRPVVAFRCQQAIPTIGLRFPIRPPGGTNPGGKMMSAMAAPW